MEEGHHSWHSSSFKYGEATRIQSDCARFFSRAVSPKEQGETKTICLKMRHIVLVSPCSLNLYDKLAHFVAELPIGVDFAFAQITDHIPVQTRLVDTARFGQRGPNGHMHGAPDLLIKERIFGEWLDVVVQAKDNITKVTRSGMGIKHGVK